MANRVRQGPGEGRSKGSRCERLDQTEKRRHDFLQIDARILENNQCLS